MFLFRGFESSFSAIVYTGFSLLVGFLPKLLEPSQPRLEYVIAEHDVLKKIKEIIEQSKRDPQATVDIL